MKILMVVIAAIMVCGCSRENKTSHHYTTYEMRDSSNCILIVEI